MVGLRGGGEGVCTRAWSDRTGEEWLQSERGEVWVGCWEGILN